MSRNPYSPYPFNSFQQKVETMVREHNERQQAYIKSSIETVAKMKAAEQASKLELPDMSGYSSAFDSGKVIIDEKGNIKPAKKFINGWELAALLIGAIFVALIALG